MGGAGVAQCGGERDRSAHGKSRRGESQQLYRPVDDAGHLDVDGNTDATVDTDVPVGFTAWRHEH